MEINEYNFSIDKRGHSNWITGKGYDTGVVYTQIGIIEIYIQGDDEHFHATRLEVFHNGRIYIRQYREKRFSRRYAVTLAKCFIKELKGV